MYEAQRGQAWGFKSPKATSDALSRDDSRVQNEMGCQLTNARSTPDRS